MRFLFLKTLYAHYFCVVSPLCSYPSISGIFCANGNIPVWGFLVLLLSLLFYTSQRWEEVRGPDGALPVSPRKAAS